MSKLKGFERDRPLVGVTAISKVQELPTTEQRLSALLAEILKLGLSPRCYGVCKRLAYMQPKHRLSANMKTLISLMCERDSVPDVLSGGLTDHEKETLVEIDSSSMSLEGRRTAHSLIDVEARSQLISAIGKTMRAAKTRKSHMLTRKVLD